DKLRDGTALADVLTDDQKARWKEMKGDRFDVVLQPGFPPGGFPGGFRPAMPARLQYLAAKSVQGELSLTEAQVKQVAELQQKWQKEVPARPATEDARTKVRELTKSVNDTIGEMLKEPQMKRLRQIEVQQQLTGGREAAVYTIPAVVRDLKLTGQQQEKIR